MALLSDASSKTQEQLLTAMLTAYNAAAFGSCNGHFEAAYAEPDNTWLGVGEFVDGEIEEGIRKKVMEIERGGTAGGNQMESLGDITGELAAIHAGK